MAGFIPIVAFESKGEVWALDMGDCTPCPADLADPRGVLNFDDIDAFARAFLDFGSRTDLTGDGVPNLDDIGAFAGSFLAGCP